MGSVVAPSEEYGPPLQIDKPLCPWDQFQSFVGATPDALAVACTHQSPGLFGIPNLPLDDEVFRARPHLRWSFKGLDQAINRLASALQSLGVKEGTPVVTFCHNRVEFVLVAYAAIKLGCVTIPISPRNLTNEEEVRHMVKTGLSVCNGERPVVVAGDEHLAFQIDGLGLFPQPPHKISLSATIFADWTAFQSLMDEHTRGTNATPMSPLAKERGGCVLFTSGTTSLPKGIYRVHSTWAVVLAALNLLEGGMIAGDRSCNNLPNNHAMAYITLTISLSVGAGVVFPGPTFDPDLMLETFYNEKITHVMMVPTMLHALTSAKAVKYPNRPMSDLRKVTFGGSSLTPETLKLVTQGLGAGGAENVFGCTEGVFISSGGTNDFSKIVDSDEVAVGWPLPGCGTRIVNPETGEIVPRNTIGEVHGCGPSVDGPYIGGVGKENWYESGGRLWYKTGDAGRMDNQGRTFITGRFKDM
jgi:acyl-CoA synthetase (AMP-forming)/AMP-acid ligase II